MWLSSWAVLSPSGSPPVFNATGGFDVDSYTVVDGVVSDGHDPASLVLTNSLLAPTAAGPALSRALAHASGGWLAVDDSARMAANGATDTAWGLDPAGGVPVPSPAGQQCAMQWYWCVVALGGGGSRAS